MPARPSTLLLALPTTDEGVPAAQIELTVAADYFEGQLDTKSFRVRFPQYPLLSTNPLVIEPERGRYVYLTKFGAIVFWNCTGEIKRDLLAAIRELPGSGQRVEEVSDVITVRVGTPDDQITFNEVWLRELSLDKLKIISLAISQSVALERFENEITAVLSRIEPTIRELRLRGRLAMSPKQVLQAVGFAFDVRAAVLANLTLFDDPPETWESEALAHLDGELFDHLDLEERLSAVNQKLAFLSDMHGMLLDVLNHRSALRLEWIIIILIFIEIFFTLWLEVVPRLLPGLT